MKLLIALCSIAIQAQSVNSGGLTTGAFAADSYFTGGTVFKGNIPSGVPEQYRTQRYGNFAYTVPVAPGEYDVILHFYELTTTITGLGQRRFKVSVNGADVLPDYDIWASGGRGPVTSTHRVTASSEIKIQLTTIARNAVLNAFEIRRVPDPGQSAWAPFQTTLSGNVLTIGVGCTESKPCIYRFGSTAYRVTGAATATVTAGTGEALIHLTPSGIAIGHPMGVTCTGCTSISGLVSFPEDSIPLYTWRAVNGQWDPNGWYDWRSAISTKVVKAGLGLAGASVGGATILSLDIAAVGLRVAVPDSAAAECAVGSWAADGAFFYICQAANSWRRAALASW